MNHTKPLALLALTLAGTAVSAACSRPPVTPADSKPAASLTPPVARAPAREEEAAQQQRAQGAWCSYLDALYRRVTHDGTAWPRLDECRAHTSTAAPAMLERTAECSRRALDGYTGDPLGDGYADAVRRCGVEAIDAVTLGGADLEPFVEVLCQRVSACGGSGQTDCRATLRARASERLGRAIGSINAASRARLRRCLEVASCDQDLSEWVGGCIDPIMDRLLWLPPDRDE
jgi:hypothetical protein